MCRRWKWKLLSRASVCQTWSVCVGLTGRQNEERNTSAEKHKNLSCLKADSLQIFGFTEFCLDRLFALSSAVCPWPDSGRTGFNVFCNAPLSFFSDRFWEYLKAFLCCGSRCSGLRFPHLLPSLSRGWKSVTAASGSEGPEEVVRMGGWNVERRWWTLKVAASCWLMVLYEPGWILSRKMLVSCPLSASPGLCCLWRQIGFCRFYCDF